MINKAWYAERQFITNRTLKSTGGEGQIYKSSLKRLCDLVDPFLFYAQVWETANLSGYILGIQNISVLLNGSSMTGVMIDSIKVLREIYFSLT